MRRIPPTRRPRPLLDVEQAHDPTHEEQDQEADEAHDQDADARDLARLGELLGFRLAGHLDDAAIAAVSDALEPVLDLVLGFSGLVDERLLGALVADEWG